MSKQRFNTIFGITTLIPFFLLLFPLFEIGNRATPIIFGLPFSFFWVILWIVITFLALIVLFILDPEKHEEGDE